MASSFEGAVIFFLIGLAISSIIIFVVTKLFNQSEGVGTAIGTALIGAIIYALAYFFLGHGLFAGLIAGFVWVLALGGMYNMSWFRSLGVGIVVWIAAIFVGFFLPTVIGPL